MLNNTTITGTLVVLGVTLSASSFGHSGKWLTDGSGQPVHDGFDRCVEVSHGESFGSCGSETKQVEAAPAPKPAPKPVVAVAPVLKPKPQPAPKPAPKPVELKKAYTLAGDALFDTNSAQLSSDGKAALDKFVTDLNDANNLQVNKINIVGHADSRGNDDYNQVLSEQRAATVGEYLISKDVEPSLITTSGRGESDPVASNATAEGRAQNRRVEIGLSGIQLVQR